MKVQFGMANIGLNLTERSNIWESTDKAKSSILKARNAAMQLPTGDKATPTDIVITHLVEGMRHQQEILDTFKKSLVP